jgi:hypothetical protein
MLRAMSRRALQRFVMRGAFGLSLGVAFLPGPCTTFDGESPGKIEPEAGVDAQPDVVDAGPSTYLSLQDAARVCSLVAQCGTLPYSIELSIGIAVDIDHFAACLHTLSSPIPPSRRGVSLQRAVLADIAKAGSCLQALAATPLELVAVPPDNRCTAPGTRTCADNGRAAIYCPNPPTDGGTYAGTYARCGETRGGTSCVEVTIPDSGGVKVGVCGIGPCADASIGEAYCEQGNPSVLHTCDPNTYRLETRYDCALVGLDCRRLGSGALTCFLPGFETACPYFGAADCVGDTARFCTAVDSAGRWSTLACGEIGSECKGGYDIQTRIGAPPTCVPKERECTPFDSDIGLCDGDAIRVCLSGKRDKFDCASIGRRCNASRHSCD